jgi:hypothetical protein
MLAALDVAQPLEAAAMLVAAGAAAGVLTASQHRRRAMLMVTALAFAGLSLAILLRDVVDREIGRRPLEIAVAAVAGLGLVAALAVLVRRRPAALGLLAVAALPFRVPLSVGGETASLLVPLYVVIVAGCLAYAAMWWRAADGPAVGERDPRLRRLEVVLAVVLVLYAAQALHSTDLQAAVKNICFFYVPFAVLFRLLLEVPWSRRLLVASLGVTVGLGLVFAAVGLVEFALGRLLIPNSKVLYANELKDYFRVNSLFFDPNIYGRFLALTMVALCAVLLWSRRSRDAIVIALVLAVLWAGLVVSLSQSSFAALLVGLAVLAGLRWRPAPVALAAAGALAAGIALVALAPGAIGLSSPSAQQLERATSGRSGLISGGLGLFRDHPVLGIGSGGFAESFRRREHVGSTRAAVASHTIPITVAAEQGVPGLIAYLALLWVALSLLFGGVRDALRRGPPETSPVARAVVAAAFCALVVHTLVYAAFLEDPLTWLLLAVGAVVRLSCPSGPPPANAAVRSTSGSAPGTLPGPSPGV